MTVFLESCTKDEVCEALGGSTIVLDDLRNRLRDWLNMQPHLPKGKFFFVHQRLEDEEYLTLIASKHFKKVNAVACFIDRVIHFSVFSQ